MGLVHPDLGLVEVEERVLDVATLVYFVHARRERVLDNGGANGRRLGSGFRTDDRRGRRRHRRHALSGRFGRAAGSEDKASGEEEGGHSRSGHRMVLLSVSHRVNPLLFLVSGQFGLGLSWFLATSP